MGSSHVPALLRRALWVRLAQWPATLCQILLPPLLVMTIGLIALSARQSAKQQSAAADQFCNWGTCGTISNNSGLTNVQPGIGEASLRWDRYGAVSCPLTLRSSSHISVRC
jgi:hypothetical protein